MHIARLLPVYVLCPEAALSKPQKGPELSFSPVLKAEGQRKKGGQAARRLSPCRSSKRKGQEKSLGPGGVSYSNECVLGGMYLCVRGTQGL